MVTITRIFDFALSPRAAVSLVLERGSGMRLYDDAGREYLDFLSGIGVASLGHAHPGLAKAIAEQATTLLHTSNLYFHPLQGDLAARLGGVPLLPAPGLRVARVEGEPAAGDERAVQVGKGPRPRSVVDEELGHVARHHRHLEAALAQVGGGALDPRHGLRAGLAARRLQRRAGGIDPRHVVAQPGQAEGDVGR